MKIEILGPVVMRGTVTSMYEYQYVHSDGTVLSAIFQAPLKKIEKMQRAHHLF